MKLSRKIPLIFTGGQIFAIFILSIISFFILDYSLNQAETTAAGQSVKSIEGYFDNYAADFTARFVDWAAWDEMAVFAGNANPQFIESNLYPQALIDMNVQSVAIFSNDGRIVFTLSLDKETGKITEIPAVLKERITINDSLIKKPLKGESLQGYMTDEIGPMVVTVQPIKNSSTEEQVFGGLMFMRRLDSVFFEKASGATRLGLSLNSVRKTKTDSAHTDNISIIEKTPKFLKAQLLIQDLYNENGFTVEISIPRDLRAQFFNAIIFILSAILIIGILFSLIISLFIHYTVIQRINILDKYITKMDFRSSEYSALIMNGNDELNKFTDTLNNLILQIRTKISALHGAASGLSDASHEIAYGVEQAAHAGGEINKAFQEFFREIQDQADLIENSRKDFDRLSDVVDNLRNESNTAVSKSSHSAQLANKGLSIMQALHKQSLLSQETARSVGDTVSKLGAKSDEIVKISEVIAGISGQTNLLALNAAIEAARAGDQGRGFAVVADEIGKLADNTTASAREIAENIKEIHDRTAETTKAMESVAAILLDQGQSIEQSGEILRQILSQMSEIESIVSKNSDMVSIVKETKETIYLVSNKLAESAGEMVQASEEVQAASEEQAASLESISLRSIRLMALSNQLEDSAR
jgi:methyl-accepting chemotaxis protein